MGDDKLNRDVTETDAVSNCRVICGAIKDGVYTSSQIHRVLRMETELCNDNRENDICIVYDSRTAAKFSAALLRALEKPGMKVNTVDLETLTDDKKQQPTMKRLQEGGWIVLHIVSLHLLTTFWSRVQKTVSRVIQCSRCLVRAVWYNVSKQTGSQYAPELAQLPDWEGSNSDDTDFLSDCLFTMLKAKLTEISTQFIPVRSLEEGVVQRRGQWRTYRSVFIHPRILETLRNTFFQQKPPASVIPVVLNGASGFGKTVMAEEFIQQFQSAYKNTFLINGSTAVTWHLSIISLCDYIGVNARRFQQCEREQLVLTEFSKSSPILILCDGLTEVCVGMLTDLVQKLKAAGNSVHMIITTRLHAIKTIDHYSVTMPKLTSTEVDSLFSMLGQWRGGSQPTDVAICGSTQLDILDGNPAACCLAKDYLAKTKSGIWALKPQYHGIWAELFFLYGKDKFSHWLEKNDIADLRVSLKLYGIHSVDDVLKAHPSFVDLPGKGKDKFLAAKRSLESELDGERLQVMVHLNLNAASRTANSIMNMLSVVGQTWLCFDILLEAWLKLYKEQTHQNAIKNLVLLETLGLVQLERHRDAIVAIRLPQSYQETVLHRLQTEKQTNYKKIVQCLAFVFSKRLTLGKAWDFQPDEVQLLPHAYEVARHCVTSSLFTVSARNLISFARELCFTLGLGTETRQLSEHLLKMEQLVSDNQFAVTREQIRVELAKQDIFNLSITDQIMVDILHTISDSLWKGGLKKLAVIVLECQASIISRCPEKLEQYPDIHVRLGEALLSIGQTQAAVESLTKAADASAVVGDTMKWKRTLNSQATAWEAAGEYAQSKMCYQKMLELVESNSEERLEILFRLGEVSNKAGHALDALGFFNHLLSKERETKLQKNMKLRAQEGMSLALKNNNDLQESLSAYQTLYTMAREEGEGEFQVNSLIGQADVYNAAHMFDSAVRMYQQALHLMEAKFRDHKDRAGCMNKLGNCHKNRRQFTLAKEVYEDCVSLCVHTGDRKSRAVALGNLGNIHQQMNDLKTALKYNMSQLELAKELNDEKMIVSANGSIGSCYSSLKNYSEALKYLHEAVEKAEKSKDLQELGRAYSNLGNVYQLSKQYSEAKRFFELSLDIVIRIGDTTGEARARGNLGNALQSLGEYKRAVQLYDVTIQLSSMPDVNDKMSEGNAYHNRGCALEGLNKLQPAKLSFEKAIAVFEQLFKQTGLSESFKPTYLQLTSKSFRRLQYVLAKLNMSREALEISERSRHRALVDIVKISKRQQKNTNSQSTDLQPEQITCDNILEMVRSQRAFVILYSICRNDMHIWTVDPTSGHLNFACKQVADDPRSESHLQKAIHSAIEDLTVYKNLHSLPEHQISDESCLESLYDWLVKPIEGWLPTRNPDLVIIPAGYIAHVPFGALKGPDGKYLSQKYRIRSVPSVMSLDADDIQDCSEANRALVVGNPLIPPVAVQGQVEPWKPVKLPHAQREAVDVAHLFNTTALTLKKATKRRVLDEMVDSDVIHIATHGNRGMTSLAFAPDVDVEVTSGQGVDPSLCLISCQDVEGLRLKAKLVVLSSCSSAWGPSTAEVHNPSGDGVMGLARAFLIAGSKSVIVTLWRVPDKATEHLMRFFYRNMQRGSPVTYSLQQAMHQVRCLEQFSHPQHWSSFQVVGSDVAIEFPPPFEVACVPDCAYFAGMEEALDTIAKWMRQDQSGLRLMYVYGMAGIGKTSVLAEFIKLYHFAFPSIFWIRGHDEITLASGIWKLAALGGADFSSEDMLEKAHEYLRSLEDWLLVLDGTDPTTVSQYLPPPTQRGHVIVTTRLPPNSLEKEGPPTYASIDLLLLDDAIASLLRRTGTTVKATDLTTQDRLALKQLVGDQCYLAYPLSLDLAAAIIRKRHSSYADFKELFDEALAKASTVFSDCARAEYDNSLSNEEHNLVNLLDSDHHASEAPSSAKSSPRVTTNVAVRSLIEMMLEDISMGARWILYCCCLLNCESIPVRLLTNMATTMGEVYMNEFSVETDEVVSKDNAHLYIAEAYSTSLLKKHRHTIVVKHQYFNVQEQERGHEVISLHPFVQQCLWDYLPNVYYPFISHSCAAAMIDSLSDNSDPLPLDLLIAHALTFCSRLVEKRHIYLSTNGIQSCRQLVEGLRKILLQRREFSEAFHRFMELSGKITALLKYDPRDRALLDMFSKLLEGNQELFSPDLTTLRQRSVNDLVVLDVREESRCVMLTPLRKADEERLSCTDFFVRSAGQLIRLQQALHEDSSFFRGCQYQDLLKIAKDIILALKNIHDDGHTAQLLRTRVTTDRILINKSEMCAWLVVTEFDTVSVQDFSSWLLKADFEGRQSSSRGYSSSLQSPERALSATISQLKPKSSGSVAKESDVSASFGSREKPLSDLGESVCTSGLTLGAVHHPVSTVQGDSVLTGVPNVAEDPSDSGTQVSRTPSTNSKDRKPVYVTGSVEVSSAKEAYTGDAVSDAETTIQFGIVTQSDGSTLESPIMSSSPETERQQNSPLPQSPCTEPENTLQGVDEGSGEEHSALFNDVSGSVSRLRSPDHQKIIGEDWVVIEKEPVISSPMDAKRHHLKCLALLVSKIVLARRDLPTDIKLNDLTSFESLRSLFGDNPGDPVVPILIQIIDKCLLESSSIDDVLHCLNETSRC